MPKLIDYTLHLIRDYELPVLLFSTYALLAAVSTARIKADYRLQTGYTRKIFHFSIFTAAAVIDAIWSFTGVIIFGAIVSLVVVWACLRSRRSALYLALARPKDSPHETLFIVLPLLSTAVGGLTSNLLFGGYAVYGYLAAGWGDALAEPVGTRWGAHKYRVPSILGVSAERSMEGSLAVFLASLAAFFMLGWAHHPDQGILIIPVIICALAATLTEAVSNHGLDNLTIQIIVSGSAYFMIN